MEADILENLRQAYERTSMVGWDFSVLDGRMTADDPWWDFEADCLRQMAGARRVLDMGTGGGERLLALLNRLNRDDLAVEATEGWEPNLAVAREALEPRGVQVSRYDAEACERMPFSDGTFGLIMSRHEAIDAQEVARVLAPGGQLLTQQVDGHDAEEIHAWFDEPFVYPDVSLENYSSTLEKAGLKIDIADEWAGVMKFVDTEALVMYLALVPWDAPGFKVGDYTDQLLALQAQRPICVTQRRSRISAVKP